MIPVPGSVVSTRSRRRAASGVPSATTTMPAWIEYPMPTPPPWCTDTHVAPDAVLRSALRTGQSAIASEPSRIDSVSRFGEATEPESRWSRPITIGALTRGRDQIVEDPSRLHPIAVAEPADAGGQPLEVNPLVRETEPADQVRVVSERVDEGAVGGV